MSDHENRSTPDHFLSREFPWSATAGLTPLTRSEALLIDILQELRLLRRELAHADD